MLVAMGDAGDLYDHRVIVNAIDTIAQNTPGAIYASIPVSTNLSDGFRNITYAQYADAINRAAEWLENNLGSNFQGETLPYIAVSDLRYPVLTLAALKIDCRVRSS